MFSLEFLVTSFVVVLVPGTGVVYAVSTGLIQGRRAAIFAALGGVAGGTTAGIDVTALLGVGTVPAAGA